MSMVLEGLVIYAAVVTTIVTAWGMFRAQQKKHEARAQMERRLREILHRAA